MGLVPPPPPAGGSTDEDVVVVAADAIATPVPDAGDPELVQEVQKKKKRKKKRLRAPTEGEVAARRSVLRWACAGREVGGDHDDHETADDAGRSGRRRPRVAVELHSHSARSDGSLSPDDLVQRAHRNGVKVLALTDHDTMAGVPEAMEAAKQFPIRIIPGVEIRAVHSPSDEMGAEEPVHILAYYGAWGPAKPQESERFLASIREGRYARANRMLLKLKDLGMPTKLEDVSKVAGNGVAPGRLHVARAMVDAGYVQNLRQAFSRYLYDGGPAYATGSEPNGKSVVQLVCRTGGVAVLAHPWALKNPAAVVKDLKAAGLHGIEVYRSDGKVSGLSDLADTYNLLKLGGSDFHGRDDKEEPDVGSVDLPVLDILNFLEVAKPIWHNATREIFSGISKRTADLNGSKPLRRASSDGDLCILSLSFEDQHLIDAPQVEFLRAEVADVVLTHK